MDKNIVPSWEKDFKISSSKSVQRAANNSTLGCFNAYNPTPQSNLDTCCWYSDSSCCIGSNVNKTGLPIRVIVNALEKIHNELGDTVSDCFYTIIDILCSFCAPNNSIFWQIQAPMTFVMCNSICDKMYTACLADLQYLVPNATKIPTNPYDLCDMVFAAEEHTVVKFADSNCFAGVPIETVKSSGCLIDLPNMGGGGGLSSGTIAGIIILVFVAAFLLLFGAGVAVHYYKKKYGQTDDSKKWFTLPENLFGKKKEAVNAKTDNKLLEDENADIDFRGGESVTNL